MQELEMSSDLDNKSKIELAYDSETGRIKLEAYYEGFFSWENDVTEQVMQIAVEKLFDDMNCPANGGVLQLERVNDKRNGVNQILAELVGKKEKKE
jgi:hypothetical protein